MRPKELPSLEKMKETFFIQDGQFYRKSGKLVDVSTHRTGYKFVCCDGSRHILHRIVYCLANERRITQDERIDHIDGNQQNNHPDNLRVCSMSQNSRNQKKRITNKSGAMGVRFIQKSNKWRSDIGVDGRRVHLGFFETFEAACDARKKAETTYGYHPNHGGR